MDSQGSQDPWVSNWKAREARSPGFPIETPKEGPCISPLRARDRAEPVPGLRAKGRASARADQDKIKGFVRLLRAL